MFKQRILPLVLLLVLSTANAQWSDDPLVNTPVDTGNTSQALALTAATPTGFCYIAWLSVAGSGDYNIRLQYFDPQGNPLWADGGILVCGHPTQTWVSDWDLAIDQEDHAVMVYSDFRAGQLTVGGYRVSPAGELIWGDAGLELSVPAHGGYSPVVTITSDNFAVFSWGTGDLPANVVYLQKASPAGELLWGDGVTVADAEQDCQLPQLVASLDGEVLLVYSRMTYGWPVLRDLWAQKFNSAGQPVWLADTPISEAGGISAWADIQTISDGDGGIFSAWADDRDNNMMLSAWVQGVSSDGNPTMPVNGVELSTEGSQHHMSPKIAWVPEAGNLIAFWEEKNSNQNQGAIYGQRLSPAGERLWGDSGMGFQGIHEEFHMILAASHMPHHQAIVYYSEFEAGSVLYSDLYAIGVDMDGEFVWGDPEVLLCDVTSQKLHPAISQCSQNQWIFAWEDDRNGNGDIYAQNLNIDGTLGYGEFPSGVSGRVTLEGGTGNVFQAMVAALGWGTAPDHSGYYFLELEPGTYDLTAALTGYNTETIVDVVVEEGVVEQELNFTLIWDEQSTAELASPQQITLLHNYPNPFNPTTMIEFSLSAPQEIQLTVHNLQGQQVAMLASGIHNTGVHPIRFDGTGLASGIYIYRLTAGVDVVTQKMILLR